VNAKNNCGASRSIPPSLPSPNEIHPQIQLQTRIFKEYIVELFAHTMFPLAAIGYSLVYLLGGGGLGGAVLIFIVAKMLGD
jgi:hypothetical protein